MLQKRVHKNLLFHCKQALACVQLHLKEEYRGNLTLIAYILCQKIYIFYLNPHLGFLANSVDLDQPASEAG